MRRAIALLTLPILLWCALPVSDAFTDANGTALATHNPAWTVVTGAFEIQSNGVVPISSGRGMARWTGETFADNQWAEGVIGFLSNGGQLGIAVRIPTNGDVTGYSAQWNDTDIYLGKLVTGTWTQLATTTVPASGSTVRLEANGTTIRVLDDSVEILSVTDSTLTSGVAGLASWYVTNRIDSWAAGNIDAGGPTRRQGRVVF